MVPERSVPEYDVQTLNGGARPPVRPPVATTTAFPADPRDLARLIEQCVPELSRRSRALLPQAARSHMCPDDLVQDVMLTTWRLANRIQPDADYGLLPYVQRALTNRAHTEARRMGRRAKTHLRIPHQVEASGPSPLELMLDRERTRHVKKALARLPARSRRLVLARYAHDWPWDRIASMLEFHSADAARVATSRAVDRLATHLSRAFTGTVRRS